MTHDIIRPTGPPLTSQVIKGTKPTLQSVKQAKYPLTHLKGVFIVADISGSMSGEKMTGLKHALQQIAKPGMKLYAFSDEVYDVPIAEAGSLVPMSGTAMMEALLETWRANPRHILLVTDGQPTDASNDKIITEAMLHNDCPIDTIGISAHGGRSYNPKFLRRLAEVTGGKFTDCNQPLQLSVVMQGLLEMHHEQITQGGAIKL